MKGHVEPVLAVIASGIIGRMSEVRDTQWSVIAILLLGVEVASFYWGFDVVDSADPAMVFGRFLALLGLVSAVAFVVVVVGLSRREWVRFAPIPAMLGLGALLALPLAQGLETEVSRPMTASLSTWTWKYMVPWMGFAVVVIAIVAVLGSVRDQRSRDVVAAPFLLLAGIHTTLLLALIFQAETIAANAETPLFEGGGYALLPTVWVPCGPSFEEGWPR